MASFTFNDEFIKCGYFGGSDYGLPSQKRLDESTYYVPLIRSGDAISGNLYDIDESLAEILNPNISFTLETLIGYAASSTTTGEYWYEIAALRANNEYGASGLYQYQFPSGKLGGGTSFIIDSESEFNNGPGIPDDEISKTALLYVLLNNSTFLPCIYSIEHQHVSVGRAYNGVPLYNDLMVRTPEDIENPYNPGGVSKPDGGDGIFGQGEKSDDISEDIPLGSVEGNASATGMFTRYLVNSGYLDVIGDWLWADELGLYVAKTFISLIYGDPAQSLISLMSYPFNLEAMSGMSVVRQNLHWGHHKSEVVIPTIRNSAVYIDWGTISIKEYWGNFLDYSPHTKIDLYLPWGTGFVSIDPGQCVPGTLRIVTNVELSKGSCIHNVIGNNGCVIGSFAGQCAKQLPLISSDFASKAAGLVTAAAAGIAAAAVSGGIAASQASAYYKSSNLHWGGTPIKFTGIEKGKYQDYAKFGTVDPNPYINTGAVQISRAIKTAGKIATSSLAINRTPVNVSRNGGFTDGSATLSVQYPYIILSRPSQNMPKEYGKHYGYPSNIYSQLGYLKGYTEVGEIHLKNIPATNDEILEIDRLLKSGVIL